jgi:hypothetical protein
MVMLRADPRFRRNVFTLYAAVIILGAAAIYWVLPALKEYFARASFQTPLSELRVALFLVFLPVLLTAFYSYRFARRVLRSDQFPPPGSKVLFDTEVIEGEPARRKARAAIALSVILVIVALVGTFYVPYWVEQLLDIAADTARH